MKAPVLSDIPGSILTQWKELTNEKVKAIKVPVECAAHLERQEALCPSTMSEGQEWFVKAEVGEGV